MRHPLLGIALQADPAFLRHNRRLIEEHAELFEIAPETLWGEDGAPGPPYEAFVQMRECAGRPFVGHGLLFSLGAAVPPARRTRWLEALRRDRDVFDFAWFSEHLGFADADGLHAALPLPLPPTPDAVEAVTQGLQALRTVHDIVAFENNADLFTLGDPLQQPAFFAAVCARAEGWMVLDLHNAYAQSLAQQVDLAAWLEHVPWDRVLEIHLSGGSESDPSWLPSGRVFRLDSHDGAVPDPVWQAFERALGRAPNLRAVVLEWVPDGMDAQAAAVLAADFARARSML